MKFDVNVLRYIDKDTWRVLVATEMGMKNHEIVPVQLINAIAGLKRGGGFKHIKELLKHKLVHHENKEYDGYRLTPLGYDYLALKAFVNRGAISGVGRKIGVGKESDVYEVVDDEGRQMALKLHRLGRTSFRDVKSKRDYLGNRTQYNWLYLSRLAALKEHSFMVALHEYGFPVPEPIDLNRHAVLMSVVQGQPLRQIHACDNKGEIYRDCMQNIAKLAEHGLVHCDYNEFNLMLNEKNQLIIIDFPQMISTNHHNAEELFMRDVNCLHRFFVRHWDYRAEEDPLGEPDPDFKKIIANANPARAIDVQLRASGFTKTQIKALDDYTSTALEDGRSESSERDIEISSGEDDEDDEDKGTDDEAEAGNAARESDQEEAYDVTQLNADEIAELSAQVQAAMLHDDDGDFNTKGRYDAEVVPMQQYNHRAQQADIQVSESDEEEAKPKAPPAEGLSKADLRRERKKADKQRALETASMYSVDPVQAADAIRQRLRNEKHKKASRASNFGAPKVNHSKEKHGRGHKEKISKTVDSFWG
mmetsp:Transcript_8995/g.29638  ORF Transcript_8995/g.29638 Transcript_8995/m.29638 type:complete len:533 (-) Transcript_8995:3595-5193(-)